MTTKYEAASPNKFDQALIPIDIRDRYFEEYIGLTPLSVFMGTGVSDVIQVFEIKTGGGTTFRVPFKKDLNYENPVIGFNQAEGSGQAIEFYQDEIRIELMRFVDKLAGTTIVKQQTSIDIFGALRPSLMDVQKKNLVKSMLDAATIDLYKKPAESAPLFDRVNYAGVGLENYETNIQATIDKMDTSTPDKSGLSVKHIRELRALATTGGVTFENEAKIKPVSLKTKKGFPEETYILLIDNESYNSLCEDPLWNQQVNRGLLQTKDQPEGLSGSRYRGTIEGVLVYECQELSKYRLTKKGDKVPNVAWNLFLGAQAIGLCWGSRPSFKTKYHDFELNVEMCVAEIRGQKALQFPSFSNPDKLIERGIIHSFTKIK